MPIVTAELGPFFLVRLTGDLTIDNATDLAANKGHRVHLFSPAPHVQKQMETQEISGLFPLIENEPDLVSRLPD